MKLFILQSLLNTCDNTSMLCKYWYGTRKYELLFVVIVNCSRLCRQNNSFWNVNKGLGAPLYSCILFGFCVSFCRMTVLDFFLSSLKISRHLKHHWTTFSDLQKLFSRKVTCYLILATFSFRYIGSLAKIIWIVNYVKCIIILHQISFTNILKIRL